MDDKTIAKKIIELVGGNENILSVNHCATRLRIEIIDKKIIEVKKIESLDKVKGTSFSSGQFQIILGTGLVNRVYNEVFSLSNKEKNNNNDDNNSEKNTGNLIQKGIRIFSDVFVPIIPVLVATGLFMGLKGLITQDAVLNIFGFSSDNIPKQLIVFTEILTDTAFAFLPALICWSTFKNFGGTPVIGIVLGLMLVSPSLPNAYEVGEKTAEPLMFFDFIPVTGYQGSVLPAFIASLLTVQFEKKLRKKIPDSIDLIATPFLTLLLGILLALFICGPIFHYIELLVLSLVEGLIFLPFGIGGLLYGSFGQLMAIFGIHHILNFLEISMLSQTNWNYINPIGTCGNVAQAGSVLAVGLKVNSIKIKQISYPSTISALLGITEPAVFGINLKFMKPFIMAMVGGGIGGFFSSIFHLKATGMGITGIPGTLLYLNEQLPIYILVNVISFITAFILTWLFGVNKNVKL